MSENKDVLGISQDNQTGQDNSVKLPDVVAKHIADISEPAPVVEQEDEKPHDPVGAILEDNVFSNEAVSKAKDFQFFTGEGSNIGRVPLEGDNQSDVAKVKKEKLRKIHELLKVKGMDSQQSSQSIKEIEKILEG